MSNDEKTNDKVNELLDDAKETVSEIVENVSGTVDEIVDDAKEIVDDVKDTATEAADSASETAGNIVSKILELKETNPKVFYGGIGALVIVILMLMMMGGDNKKSLPITSSANISVGQTYKLKGVNTYDPAATVRLVAIPGSMAAYDDSEEKDRGGCKNLSQGTAVKVTQLQKTGQVQYVEVEMVGGECAGKKGWTISNNLN